MVAIFRNDHFLKSDLFGKAFKNIGNSFTFPLSQLRILTFQFPGKSIQDTIMILQEFLEGIRINKKLPGFKTCQKHEMNFSLTETKDFFVSHNACVNISQTRSYPFGGIPEMLVFEFM